MRIFVTGASGWIGSSVVPELIGSGHRVIGLARSDASAAALEAAGIEVRRGTLDDLDILHAAAAEADGVIHLAFKHDIAFSGDFAAAAEADRLAVETFGAALSGSGKPFVLASGVIGLVTGRVATEADMPEPHPYPAMRVRQETAQTTLDFAAHGIRSSVVRLAPTVHGAGDPGFIAALVGIARATGVSGYVGDGANVWPAVHRHDAARLFRLALENAPARAILHATAEDVPVRTIAEVIGRHVGVPIASIAPEKAAEHFGFLGAFIDVDARASSTQTQELLGWKPSHPGLIADLEAGPYFATAAV